MQLHPEKKSDWRMIGFVIVLVCTVIFIIFFIDKTKMFHSGSSVSSIGTPTNLQADTKPANLKRGLARTTPENPAELFRYDIEVPGYGKYRVESPGELTDAQVYEAAKGQISKDATKQDRFGQISVKNKSTYSIRAPDGHFYTIEGPTGASQQDVINAILAQYPEAGIFQTQTQQSPFTFLLNGSPVICTKFSGIVNCNTL